MDTIGSNNSDKSRIYDKDQLEKAEDIAFQTHFWQTRRDGSTYLSHLKRVQVRAKVMGYKKRIQILAILHDALEDGVDPKRVEYVIRKNLKDAERVLTDLKLLTHKPGENYSDYVLNIYHRSVDAFCVKMVDICDNISDKPTEKQFMKYKLTIIHLLKNGVPLQKIPKQIINILKLEK